MLLRDQAVVLKKQGENESARAVLIQILEKQPQDRFAQSLLKEVDGLIRYKKSATQREDIKTQLNALRDIMAANQKDSTEMDLWSSRPVRLAIMNLESDGQPLENLADEENFIQELVYQLNSNTRWKVVEKEELLAVMDEMGVSATELSDAQSRTRLGNFLAARGLMFPSLNRRGPDTKIWIRIADTETREIIAMSTQSTTAEVSVTVPDLVKDIDRQLKESLPLRGRVLSASGTVLINIGEIHGVNKGDRFDLFLKEQGPQTNGVSLGLQAVGALVVQGLERDSCVMAIEKADLPLETGMRVQLVSNESFK
jgi:hypothetical protein